MASEDPGQTNHHTHKADDRSDDANCCANFDALCINRDCSPDYGEGKPGKEGNESSAHSPI